MMATHTSRTDETHPLLANYVERQTQQEENSGSERSSEMTFAKWTTCDELKRCSCAILSFILMAGLVGSGLVLFWFLWAWFVLYLDLPGVLTPIIWLAGFLLPLCLLKLFQSCPRCTRSCFAEPLMPPDINAWKTHHLWNQRRKFILKIHQCTPLPLNIAEMISNFCFHSDILVTTNKNKLVGIYPDTAKLHTVAEFSKNITDLAVANGNIHKVFILMSRETEKTALNCRERLGCFDVGDSDQKSTDNPPPAAAAGGGGVSSYIPSWIYSGSEHVDMIICEYDIASGSLNNSSLSFNFSQILITTMEELRGIYYKPSYRLLIDATRDVLVVSRDGDFIIFDSQTLQQITSREIISHPDSRDDREQFIHLREYKWNASRIIPTKICRNIISIVDQVEGTESNEYLYKSSDVYIIIPFGSNALFVCNINSGWLRYLDFSNVDPISTTSIHFIEFSIDNQYIYLVCTNTLSVLSTSSFQPILTVSFSKLNYIMPCGLIRTPPTEQQILLMLNKFKQKQKQKQNQIQIQTKKHDLTKKLESISIIYASTRVFMDPRIFLYRFPDNKSRVISKNQSIYSNGSFLINRVMNESSSSKGQGGQWQYISMKQQKPWTQYKTLNNNIDYSNYIVNVNNNSITTKQDKFIPILNRV